MKFKEYPNTTSLADNDAFIVDGDGGTKHILVKDSLATKVDKVEGKGLSTNDLTDDYKSKLDALNSNLAGKATNTSVLRTTVPNQPFTPTSDYHPATKKYVDDSVANKVDKVEGKGLSTNDLTDDYKSKLDALNSNLAGKATNTSVLRTTVPNQPFTPTSDYHPATKKYVDDSVKAVGSLSNLTTTEKTSIVAAINELKAAIDALKGS